MCLVGVWDLGVGRKPGSSQIPQVSRRVGADILLLANHTAANTDTIARNAGYRHKAKLLAAGTPVAILSRFPVSGAHVHAEPFGLLACADVHVPHGPLRVMLAAFDAASEPDATQLVAAEMAAAPRTLVLAGHLGHDLANPVGAWHALRQDLTDLVETSGVHAQGARFDGALGRGVEVRGAGIVSRAGGGDTPLTWVRVGL